MSISETSVFSWEAKDAVEVRVLMSRIMTLMMSFPCVEVWASMWVLAASPFTASRAVMITLGSLAIVLASKVKLEKRLRDGVLDV